MRELNIAGVMITCPGREAMLKATLADLRQHEVTEPRLGIADGHQALRLHVQRDESDVASRPRPQDRQEHNSLAALQTGLQRFPDADVLLFFEDDIIFNRHLMHNLQRWSPLRNIERSTPGQVRPSSRRYVFGSLYDPNVRELSSRLEENYFVADPEAVYGSQAFVMSRGMAEHFVMHWWEIQGMQDIKMSRLAARLGPIYYHQPSLVQHVGVTSTWTDDARFHETKIL